MIRQCLCEICNCGRHRCPHRPTALYGKGNQACEQTEYTEKYPAYGAHRPPKSMKPKPVDHNDRGKMDGTTTFKTDFIPYEVNRRPGRKQAEHKPYPGEIDMGTTYKQDFNPYQVTPCVAVRPKQRVQAAPGKLDTVPTYKDDFKVWQISKRELTKRNENYQPSSAKFQGTSTFQDDFIDRGLVPRESFKPSSVPMLSEVPFDGVTSNHLSYVPHPTEARYVKAPEVYKPSTEPLQDMTTQRRDFQGLPGQLARSCKPDPAKASSDAPFDGSTEFQQQFQQWPVSLPQLHKPLEYVGPTLHMDMSTTSAVDFVKHNIQPFTSAKPFCQPLKSSVPFQGYTTMREDFQPWATPRQALMKKREEEMHKATGKMDDLTTFKAHYTTHKLQPNISFKPPNTVVRRDTPLESGTMYSTEFTPKRISVCLASYDSPPGFVFEDSDHNGHRFYRKLSSKGMMQASNVPVQKAVVVQ
ncbi:stabilizer of axonemal microtubules 2 isoform X1 [Hypomesus transpacificus]|uniref:stabilizer of axonemal microtubules 2 isoform X1 n=1 Tax=Hypomesus transpacificus TaxID=137520 RepID=UPI001F0762C8|nr:stabilizer of axonemal microtubules 2 isoform X1 [Hypomesus transpacificus]